MIENNKIMGKVKYGQKTLGCYGYQTLRNGRTIIRKQINTFAAKPRLWSNLPFIAKRDYGTLRNDRTIIRKQINSEAIPVRISGKGVRLYKCKGVHIADFISFFLNIP